MDATGLADKWSAWALDRDPAWHDAIVGAVMDARRDLLGALECAELALHIAQRYIRAGEGQPPYYDRMIPTCEQIDRALTVVRSHTGHLPRSRPE